MLRRNLEGPLRDALSDRPVVLLHGARQTGKSTLTRAALPDGRYITLDDATALAAARNDPGGFVTDLGPGPVILDEVQHAPDLFGAIKANVDRDRRPGRFLLTGSANIMLVPRASESLAGRMEILPLRPLSQGEIEGRVDNLIDVLFARKVSFPGATSKSSRNLQQRIVMGGFPEVVTKIKPDRRAAWFSSYLAAITQRDVRDIMMIDDLTALPRMLGLLASRTSGLLNFADIARASGIPQTTLKRYFTLLEATFLVHVVRPWHTNTGLRLVKAPKVLFEDTGLAASLLALDETQLTRHDGPMGSLLENFVGAELLKQSSWSKARPSMYHFRTQVGREVDFVLENQAGMVVGIEVKASGTINSTDFRGLHALAEAADERFHAGVILYGGREVVPFGRGMFCVPVEFLWA